MISQLRVLLLAGLLFLLSVPSTFAHEGHAEPPSQTDNVPIAGSAIPVSETVVTNLGIKTEAARLEKLAPSLNLNGIIDVMPQAYAKVSSRFDGRVSELKAAIGDAIEKGQPLAVVEPLVLGSSPVTIMAPLSGRLTMSTPAIGQSVTPSDILFEIVDLATVLVQAQVYETPDLASIKPELTVRVTSRSYPNLVFSGRIERIDPALDPELRTLSVYAVVDNTDLKLLRHMQVSMSVEIGESSSAVTVPRQAVLGDAGNHFVFVRDSNGFSRREVKLGMRVGDRQVVTAGVRAGDKVVTVGQYQLQFATPSKPAAAHAE